MLSRRRTLAPAASAGVETTYNNNFPRILRRYRLGIYYRGRSAGSSLERMKGRDDCRLEVGKLVFGNRNMAHPAKIKFGVLSCYGWYERSV